MEQARHLCFLLLLCLLPVGAGTQEQPTKPPQAKDLSFRVLLDSGWGLPEFEAGDEKGICSLNNAKYDCWHMVYGATTGQKPKIIFNRQEISAERVTFVLQSNGGKNYIDTPPVAVIIAGGGAPGEKRMYVALQRKEYWYHYSMRLEIEWTLEFDKNTEPEFAADVRFDKNCCNWNW